MGIGRFVTPDSIVPNFRNPQSLNRYAYVLNNPMRFVDPTGHYIDDSGDTSGSGGSFYDDILNGSDDFTGSGFDSGNSGYDSIYGQIVNNVMTYTPDSGIGSGIQNIYSLPSEIGQVGSSVSSDPIFQVADSKSKIQGTISYGGNSIPYTNGPNGRELLPVRGPESEGSMEAVKEALKVSTDATEKIGEEKITRTIVDNAPRALKPIVYWSSSILSIAIDVFTAKEAW